ncbi:hypothetical protein F5B19DRAFT_94792 [Rostrohypoxylon terebratum]|nr:hypothetical protein F5B19DRAFT_94792 [Rostrohypoxylon terebratum]
MDPYTGGTTQGTTPQPPPTPPRPPRDPTTPFTIWPEILTYDPQDLYSVFNFLDSTISNDGIYPDSSFEPRNVPAEMLADDYEDSPPEPENVGCRRYFRNLVRNYFGQDFLLRYPRWQELMEMMVSMAYNTIQVRQRELSHCVARDGAVHLSGQKYTDLSCVRSMLNNLVHRVSMVHDLVWIESESRGHLETLNSNRFPTIREFYEPQFEITYSIRVREAKAIWFWATQRGNRQVADIFRWVYWFVNDWASYRYFVFEAVAQHRGGQAISEHWGNTGGLRCDLLFQGFLDTVFDLIQLIQWRRRRIKVLASEVLPMRERASEFIANIREYQWSIMNQQLYDWVCARWRGDVPFAKWPDKIDTLIRFSRTRALPPAPSLQLDRNPPMIPTVRVRPQLRHPDYFWSHSGVDHDAPLARYGWASHLTEFTPATKQYLFQSPMGLPRFPRANKSLAISFDESLSSEDDSEPEPTPLADLYQNITNDFDRRPKQHSLPARSSAGLSTKDSIKRKADEDLDDTSNLKRKRRLSRTEYH